MALENCCSFGALQLHAHDVDIHFCEIKLFVITHDIVYVWSIAIIYSHTEVASTKLKSNTKLYSDKHRAVAQVTK